MAEETKQKQEKQEYKFPTETIDLPSEGKCYPEGSPLQSGKIDIKYMTAKEEDILTSENLIKKGLVIDKLLNSLIVTPGITTDDLLIGDKNAVMVAARILAYGGQYNCEIQDPNTGEKQKHSFDLTECKFKGLADGVDYSNNEFELELPVTKTNITFKLLTGRDEVAITNDLKKLKKIGQSGEVTTRLRYVIQSVNGDSERPVINNFVYNMLYKESFVLRD